MAEPSTADPAAAPAVAEQFGSLAEQTDVAKTGMWCFLGSEILFFGGLFLSYAVYRGLYPAAFAAAGRRTDILLGTINTAVLLTSSAFMAVAVGAAEAEKRRILTICLALTAGLGLVFLGLKGTEYAKDFSDRLVPGVNFTFEPEFWRGAQLFFLLYFTTTLIHALHMTIGIVLVSVFAWRAHRGAFEGGRHVPVAILGLYWHFVDFVWVFLYPVLYLNGRA